MKTYQDLETLGTNEKDRADFVKALVREHCNTTYERAAAERTAAHKWELSDRELAIVASLD